MENKDDDHEIDEKVIYVPSGSGQKEKILFGGDAQLGDRRHRIKPYEDERAIIKCSGMIWSHFDKHAQKIYIGTGTVFHVKDGMAYIITCAHNVVKEDYEGVNKYPLSVKFVREHKWGQKQYDAAVIASHEEYIGKDKDPNDLAILRIRDDDEFHLNIFSKNANIVHLLRSDDIKDSEPINYNLYGYPQPKYDQCCGQLWGMEATSSKECDKINQEMYVKKNKKGTLFIYNAIDTEGGQSGAAIFISLSDGTFGIVGVHTGGDKPEGINWGVALNKDKILWLNTYIQSPTPIHLEIFSRDGHFIYSVSNIRLMDNSVLVCDAKKIDGSVQETKLDLNTFISNQDGTFYLGGGDHDFSKTAKNVQLLTGGRVLQCEMKTMDGNWKFGWMDLNDFISNVDGKLVGL